MPGGEIKPGGTGETKKAHPARDRRMGPKRHPGRAWEERRERRREVMRRRDACRGA